MLEINKVKKLAQGLPSPKLNVMNPCRDESAGRDRGMNMRKGESTRVGEYAVNANANSTARGSLRAVPQSPV